MLFNSFEFAIFLPIMALAFYACKHSLRWIPMLLGSYVFYMWWNPSYILLIVASTVVDYFVALRLASESDIGKRKRYLALSLIFNLGLLFTFKYFNFFIDNVNQLATLTGIDHQFKNSSLLLPVGISFYTFQTLSYSIDVYRRKLEPEPHFGRFALYVSFFPQLVAGPIERAVNLLPELRKRVAIDPDQIAVGLKLIVWGLFTKMVIADRLADYVNRIYGDVEGQTGTTLLVATYFFAFQIFCDFSGYSNIAIGTARLFGVRLMQNFNLPYLATGISDFWSRWHISLSTWFRDYVYFPLGGSRVSILRWMLNISVVFVVSGVWHGANWTFVVWGAIHACLYFLERLFKPVSDRLGKLHGIPRLIAHVGCVLLTFHVVLLAWVFFRAQSLGQGVTIISKILTEFGESLHIGSSSVEFALSAASILFLVVIQISQYTKVAPFYGVRGRFPLLWSWVGTLLLALGVLLLGKSNSDFIYFQF